MKQVICVLLIVAIVCVGCAGTDPNPIAAYLPGDENKSCSALKAEIANIDKQIWAFLLIQISVSEIKSQQTGKT